MTSFALIPLDERPVNTRCPAMIAAIAGLEVRLPPLDLLSQQRQPADTDRLGAWVTDQFGTVDTMIASVEMLAFGGLLASRIDSTPLQSALARLDVLKAKGDCRLYAFNVITRIPNADDAREEPSYWAQWGRQIHRYSQWMHRAELDASVQAALAAAHADLPADVIADFTERRLRNHLLNLHMLGLAAGGAVDTLVLSSDDTSVYGMGSQEKAWLHIWARRFGLPPERLLMYPGADEVGCVLLMRAAHERAGAAHERAAHAPTFYIAYAIEADREIVAPYEDSPIRVTVERQIAALGGRIVERADQADLIVAVNPPTRMQTEYDPAHPLYAAETARRQPALVTFTHQIREWIDAGRRVIVADVAYPNGSDPALIDLLRERVNLPRLAAYGAWNTAGNTIGTALAQGAALMMGMAVDASPEQRAAMEEAQARFLLHRFIEDWGYQHLVRDQVRAALESVYGEREPTSETEAWAITQIHERLNALLPRLGRLAEGWRIGRVWLPWHRTFEIDFELERL
ncbi:MAG: DUF4127 family protein [bacterium]|nr:DUF4127 family protein [bacterium]